MSDVNLPAANISHHVKNVAFVTWCPLSLLAGVRTISDPHVFAFHGQNYNSDNSGDDSSTLLPEEGSGT